MDVEITVRVLGALGQPTRLEAFRLLVRHEPDGLPAGEVARLLDVPQNTMSAHLATLSRAGLVSSDRHSRSVIYRAELQRLSEMMLFLAKDCCGGRAELCAPLIASFVPCCPPEDNPSLARRAEVAGCTEGKEDQAS
jgi:DNA-binding transcriptional ArsR family regulator